MKVEEKFLRERKGRRAISALGVVLAALIAVAILAVTIPSFARTMYSACQPITHVGTVIGVGTEGAAKASAAVATTSLPTLSAMIATKIPSPSQMEVLVGMFLLLATSLLMGIAINRTRKKNEPLIGMMRRSVAFLKPPLAVIRT